MSKITVKVEGLDKLLKSLQNESEEIKQQIAFEIQESANSMANGAAADAPVDMGILRVGISSFEVDELTYDVVSNAEYSAYVEFGTLSSVSIPPGFEDVAAQYRGKGLRTGKGMRPRPFFFKQLAREKTNLIKNIKQVLKNR